MTTVLALLAMVALLGVFLHCSSCIIGEIIHGEIEGDGPLPGAERLPLYAAAAIVAYLTIGHFLIT